MLCPSDSLRPGACSLRSRIAIRYWMSIKVFLSNGIYAVPSEFTLCHVLLICDSDLCCKWCVLCECKNLILSLPTVNLFYHILYCTLSANASVQLSGSVRCSSYVRPATEMGLGGALLQPNPEGKLQLVAYTSCSLSPAERGHSQIEKECLAICQAFSKFDQWLFGKSDIEVHTDHKPLESILRKPLNKAPTRLQRMMMRLQR